MSRKPVWVLAVALDILIPACDQGDPPGRELPGSGLIAFVPPDPRDVGISLLGPERGKVSRPSVLAESVNMSTPVYEFLRPLRAALSRFGW